MEPILDRDQIRNMIQNSSHNKVRVAVSDIDGVMRGKLMHKDKFLSALEADFGFCNVVFGWDINDASYDNVKVSGWHTGYPDQGCFLDPATFRFIPWENELPFILGDFKSDSNSEFQVCPRSLLRNISKKCSERGFTPIFAQEFEWFNYKQSPEQLYEKNFQKLKPLTSGMFGYSVLKSSEKSDFFEALWTGMEEFGVPLEGLHTETGPGVYEAAIRYTTIMKAADRAFLFKSACKEIGYRHGIIASFMAKPFKDLPGCSGHIHQSLWDDKNQKNLFFDDSDDFKMSSLFKSYLAGQLYCLPYILPMYAPTINSYKRLVEGAWAPTTITWGIDNRTTAFRVLPGGENSSRLETRVVGSDVNPYLAMAACLASGLYGIQHNLNLEAKQTRGNGYEDDRNGTLPSTLIEATEMMKSSSVAHTLFGEEFVGHFTKSREWEWRQYSAAVTDWERKRYLEII